MKRRGFLGMIAGAAASIPFIGPALAEGLGERWPAIPAEELWEQTGRVIPPLHQNCRCVITALTDPLILDVGDKIAIHSVEHRLMAADRGVVWEGTVTENIIFFEADGIPVYRISGVGDDGRRMRCEFTRGSKASMKCWITQDHGDGHGTRLWIPEDGQGWQIAIDTGSPYTPLDYLL